jgi:protein-S-isoprenylcysteine O-methyltransferase Ste14
MLSVATLTYIVWFSSEILLNRIFRSGAKDIRNKDRNSLRYIWWTIIFSISIGVYLSRRYFFPISIGDWMPITGLVMIWFGVILRFYVIRTLGSFFTVDVTIRENHLLKTNGCYKYLRHPSYSAALVSFTGFGLALNNWFSLLMVTLPVFFVFIVRIRIEEQVLIEKFGEAYLDYRKSTWAVIPFIY